MFDQPEQRAAEKAAAVGPQPGDLWHEMYSWWLLVLAADGTRVVTLEGAGAGMNIDRQSKTFTKEEFEKYLSYQSSVPGYWMMLHSRGNSVEGLRQNA
jgi:hypothetical protein